ncbi:MAG: hypothetical protein CO064_02855 [Anaerolineae bacterium CG_4_9_14_0_8_um_filter_58_9]|nr:MAG: hypothetical protein CO064_02855 [Anaerolineae bacterium CG_4_9_14_0_8_um_filter_58_9]
MIRSERATYWDRWMLEQIPLSAEQMVGAHLKKLLQNSLYCYTILTEVSSCTWPKNHIARP